MRMTIEEFLISDECLVRTSGTSDGTQDKYFKDGTWFKLDRHGGEGMAETLASSVLNAIGFPNDLFVEYKPCIINGKNGCYSKNFLKENESFITFYRLYKNVTGRDLATVCPKMDYDDAIEYVINFVKEQTKLDIHEYLANIFFLDMLILNADRHFNNLGIIYDDTSFKLAPIFDNGKSFFIGNSRAKNCSEISEKINTAYAKVFSPSFKVNYAYLKKYCMLKCDANIVKKLPVYEDVNYSRFIEILKHTIK